MDPNLMPNSMRVLIAFCATDPQRARVGYVTDSLNDRCCKSRSHPSTLGLLARAACWCPGIGQRSTCRAEARRDLEKGRDFPTERVEELRKMQGIIGADVVASRELPVRVDASAMGVEMHSLTGLISRASKHQFVIGWTTGPLQKSIARSGSV